MTTRLSDLLETDRTGTALSQVLSEAKKAKKLSKAAIGMAQAYGDAWEDSAYSQYVPQVVPDALDRLMKDPDVQKKLSSMVERNLGWRSDVWTSPAEWTEAAKLFVPGYNNFDAADVGKWLAKFPGIQVQAAREGSVALYVKGDAETLKAMYADAERAVSADEVFYEVGGEVLNEYEPSANLRLWWD